MKDKKIIFLGLIPTIWLGLLIAPISDDGILSIIKGFSKVINNPFKITFCSNTLTCILICLCIYIMAIAIYFSTKRSNFFRLVSIYNTSIQQKTAT